MQVNLSLGKVTKKFLRAPQVGKKSFGTQRIKKIVVYKNDGV